MKVFFTCSRFGKTRFQKEYDLVRRALVDLKVELISPEAANYHLLLTQKERVKYPDSAVLAADWKKHYEVMRRAIAWADAVVLEVSEEDFQLGHEATLAVVGKKPVLALSVKEDLSQRVREDEYFVGAKYNESSVQAIIQDFLAKVRGLTLSKRFNLFLYPSQLAHIDHAGKRANMNRSEYIRHLINEDRKNQE